MDVLYVSHPYGGKQENEAKADAIVRALQISHPDVCFVSPVHAIRAPYSRTDYVQGLEYCLALLALCNGIVMCGNWQESRGCVAEYFAAKMKYLPVYTGEEMLNGEGFDEALAYARGEEFE